MLTNPVDQFPERLAEDGRLVNDAADGANLPLEAGLLLEIHHHALSVLLRPERRTHTDADFYASTDTLRNPIGEDLIA